MAQTVTRRTPKMQRAKEAHHAKRLDAVVATIRTREEFERVIARMPEEWREATRAELAERLKGRIDGL